jgi:hypothetical protein
MLVGLYQHHEYVSSNETIYKITLRNSYLDFAKCHFQGLKWLRDTRSILGGKMWFSLGKKWGYGTASTVIAALTVFLKDIILQTGLDTSRAPNWWTDKKKCRTFVHRVLKKWTQRPKQRTEGFCCLQPRKIWRNIKVNFFHHVPRFPKDPDFAHLSLCLD